MSSQCRFKFWGVRGSVPAPGAATVHYGGNTSCVEVRADGEIIILDAGTGIRPLGLALAAEFGAQPMNLTVLISHTHWDHIQGFPFFLPAYNAANKIRILGYEGAREGLAAAFAGQMETPYFPIGFDRMPGHITVGELKHPHFSIGAIKVRACFLNHPGICAGYRLFTGAGSIAYVPDNEPCGPRVAALHREPETKKPGRKNELAEFLNGADVLIMDAQYDEAEYEEHAGWGHGCVRHAVELALKANVKKVFLFHHDPDHDDARVGALLARARNLIAEKGAPLVVEAAREGEEIVLG